MSTTAELCGYLTRLEYEQLPPEAVAKAKHCLMDYVGYTSCGYEARPARILGATLREMGGTQEATVIGKSWRLPAVNAAFLNGATGHMMELDDTHRGTQSHPGDSVLPAALAMAERGRATGRALITAIVAGYEAAIRVGEAVMPSHYTRGWHPSGTMNTFGAAVAAGKLLSLDEASLTQGMSIAAGQAAGNFAHLQERGMMKDFNPGRAAANGVLAALLAKRGFTGSSDAVENRRGFGALYSDTFHPNELTNGLGGPPKILEVAHKPFPGCRHLHSSRDALLGILSEACKDGPLRLEEVRKVTASIFSTGAAYVDDPVPWAPGKGSYGPNFSVQFNLALVLEQGEDGLRRLFEPTYAVEKVKEPQLQELMAKVEVVHDEELNRLWPRAWASEVTMKTARGTYTRRVDLPKGEPENPMSYQELRDKFTILATAAAFSRDQSQEIVDAIERLDEIADATELTRLLSASQESEAPPP